MGDTTNDQAADGKPLLAMTWRIFASRFAWNSAAIVILMLPVQLLGDFLRVGYTPGGFTSLLLMNVMFVLMVLLFAVYSLAFIAVMVGVSDTLKREHYDIGTTLKRIGRNAYPAVPVVLAFFVTFGIMVSAAYYVPLSLGHSSAWSGQNIFGIVIALLSTLGCAWWAWRLVFTLTASSMDGMPPRKAFRYSRALVNGRAWRIGGRLIPALLPLIVVLAFTKGLIGPDLDDIFAIRLVDKLLLDYSLVFVLTAAAVLYRRIERETGVTEETDVQKVLDHAETERHARVEGPGFWGH